MPSLNLIGSFVHLAMKSRLLNKDSNLVQESETVSVGIDYNDYNPAIPYIIINDVRYNITITEVED